MWIAPQLLFMILVIFVAFISVLRIPNERWALRMVLMYLVGMGFVVEAVGNFMAHQGENNSSLYNAFIPIEFVLVLAVLQRIRPEWNKAWALCLAVGMLGIGYCYYKGLGKGFVVAEAALIISVVLSIGIMAVLWSLANNSTRSLVKLPEFWLLVGLLLYFGGMVPVIASIRFLFEMDKVLAGKLWLIAPYLCIVRYAFTAYAAILARRTAPAAHG